MFLGIVDNVDLHHGEYSHTPAWSVLEVYGVDPSIMIKSMLEEYGQGSFVETEGGFIFSCILGIWQIRKKLSTGVFLKNRKS